MKLRGVRSGSALRSANLSLVQNLVDNGKFGSGQKDIAGYKGKGQISSFWDDIMTKQKIVWICKIVKV